MKKWFAVAVLAVMVVLNVPSFAASSTQNAPITVAAGETEEEARVALVEFTKFAEDHKLLAGYRDGSAPGTYDVALFVTDENGQAVGDPKWVVFGAASLTKGVKQIEADFAEFPDGNIRYVSQPDPNPKKPEGAKI